MFPGPMALFDMGVKTQSLPLTIFGAAFAVFCFLACTITACALPVKILQDMDTRKWTGGMFLVCGVVYLAAYLPALFVQIGGTAGEGVIAVLNV